MEKVGLQARALRHLPLRKRSPDPAAAGFSCCIRGLCGGLSTGCGAGKPGSVLAIVVFLLIAASATTRIPPELGRIIGRLKQEKHWTDDDLVTAVKSSEVVASGLVKQQIMLGGYVTPMEVAVDDMLDGMKKAEAAATAARLPFRPKAIYVSNTNIVSGAPDNPALRFADRQARPIQIWRHLVENRGIDPATIAVYCNLKFDRKAPGDTSALVIKSSGSPHRASTAARRT